MKRSVQWMVCALLCLSACGSVQTKLAVSGRVAEKTFSTTVDHPMARYYIEREKAGATRHPAWDEVIEETHARFTHHLPTSDELAQLSRTYSTDFATLVLARQLDLQARELDFYRAFLREAGETTSTPRPRWPATPDAAMTPVIAFVPGWLYQSDRTTGADFARYRQLLSQHGVHAELIPAGENATVEHNATLIADRVRALAARGERVILVSGSKGGPETALALTRLRQDTAIRNVKAWVNVGGLLRGTPLADLGLTWPVCWFVQLAILPDSSFEGIRSLSVAASEQRWKSIALPAEVLVVNYVALPLSGQVSGQARGGYDRLRAAGPNDGLTTLNEAIMPGGITIPEFGADHYFRGPELESRILALARVLIAHPDHPRFDLAAYRDFGRIGGGHPVYRGG